MSRLNYDKMILLACFWCENINILPNFCNIVMDVNKIFTIFIHGVISLPDATLIVLYKLKQIELQKANNKGTDQTVWIMQASLYLCCLLAIKSGFLADKACILSFCDDA